MANSFARGETIKFSATFTDENGDPVTPASVALTIAYQSGGRRVTDEMAMTNSGGTFTKDWDSSVAQAGTVFYRIESAGSPIAVEQGVLELVSNAADV